MLDEQVNLHEVRADEAPPSFGLSIIARSNESTSEALLERVRSVWQVVASWGRWCDDELGDWPAAEEVLERMPPWFRSSLQALSHAEIEAWTDDLHDRAWIWWSGAALDQFVKIDLQSDSLPVTLWPLVFVVEKSGGQVVYRDLWKDTRQI